jgi:hypothetical protein
VCLHPGCIPGCHRSWGDRACKPLCYLDMRGYQACGQLSSSVGHKIRYWVMLPGWTPSSHCLITCLPCPRAEFGPAIARGVSSSGPPPEHSFYLPGRIGHCSGRSAHAESRPTHIQPGNPNAGGAPDPRRRADRYPAPESDTGTGSAFGKRVVATSPISPKTPRAIMAMP